MIEIKVRKLSKKEASDSIMSASANASSKGVAKALRKLLKDWKCEKHPDTTSIITVIADSKELTKFEMTSFCCKEFEERLKLSTDLDYR